MRVFRGGWLTAAISVVAMLLAGQAFGQVSRTLPETRAIQLGPVSVYPQIALRDVGTDSNVYSDSTAPRSDLTYSLTPSLYAVMPIGNTRFVGTGLGDLVYFRTYEDQRSLTTQFDGRYEVTSPGFRPFVSAGLVSRGGREGFEIDARPRRTQNTVMVGADVDVTPMTAITAWASRSKSSFDEEEEYLSVSLAEQLNHHRNSAAAGARFRVTPLTTLLIAAEVQQDRFERLPLRDADSFRLTPSLAIDTGGTMSGDVNAGYRVFTPRDASLTSYRGFVGAARLHYTLRGVTRFDVEVERDIDFSFDPTQPYYLESGGRLVVTHRVLGPIDVIGIGERRDLRNQRVGGTSFDGRREVTTSVGGGVSFQIQTQTRVALTYERSERTSSEPVGRNFERTRVLGSFIYGL
jgi:hypothetical protein